MLNLQVCRGCAIAAAAGNKVTLLGCSTHAATAAAVAARAALRLALVVLKEEQVVWPRSNLGA